MPLSLSHKCLIAANCLNSFYEIFIGFMILVIVSSFANPIAAVAIYHFMLFGMVVLGFVFIVKNVKRGGVARMWAYRTGVLIGIASLVLIATQGMEGNAYIVGAMFGAYAGLQAFAKEAVISDTVSAKQMTKFTSYNSAAGSSFKLFAPALIGIIAGAYSYSVAAIAIIPLLLASFVVSFFIDGGGGGKDHSLQFSKFIRLARRSLHMKRVFIADFLMGITLWGSMGTITAIYAAQIFETPASVGMLGSIVMAFLIAVKFAIARFGGAKHLAAILKVAIAVFFIVAAVFLTLEGKAWFVAYNLAYVALASLMEMQMFIYMWSALRVAGISPRLTSEYQFVRQITLNIGRYIGYGALFGIGIFGAAGAMKWILIAMMGIVVIVVRLYYKMNRDEGHKL